MPTATPEVSVTEKQAPPAQEALTTVSKRTQRITKWLGAAKQKGDGALNVLKSLANRGVKEPVEVPAPVESVEDMTPETPTPQEASPEVLDLKDNVANQKRKDQELYQQHLEAERRAAEDWI